MSDFVEVVGLGHDLDKSGASWRSRDFEEVFGELHERGETKLVQSIEKATHEYFSELTLGTDATLYDHLVLSLRPKDLIATFNWDPFLYQAVSRNHKVLPPPRFVFLHGNAAIGRCAEDRVAGSINETGPGAVLGALGCQGGSRRGRMLCLMC